MLSLRGPEFDDKPIRDDRLPPIHQEPEPEMLFQSRTDLKQAQSEHDYMRTESRLSLTSPERLVGFPQNNRNVSFFLTEVYSRNMKKKKNYFFPPKIFGKVKSFM